jgi:hypothetical protein
MATEALDTDDTILGEEDEEETTEPLLALSEDEANLVPAMEASDEGTEALKKISEKCRRDFESAWEASEGRRQRFAKDWKLFEGRLPPKVFPSPHAANAHVPIMFENLCRLHFRIYDEVFGDFTQVFGVLPVGPAADPIAEILTIHGNWQIREQMPDFQAQMHRMVQLFLFDGEAVVHSYFDAERRLNQHDALTPEEFVMPYSYRSTKPDLSDLPYYCRILNTHRHTLQKMKQMGLYEHTDDLLNKRPPSWDDEPEQVIAEAGAETSDVESQDDDSSAPYKLIWYEGWLELPGHDQDRFCRCIFDNRTGHVLLLNIHEQPNWQDKLRYENEMREAEQYTQALQMSQAMGAQVDGQVQQIFAARDQGMVPHEQAAQMAWQVGQTRPPEPELPGWMSSPEQLPAQPEMEPIRMFARGKCIEPLAGSKGVGYGAGLADYNRAANTMQSQYIDGASLNNAPVFLAADGFKVPADFQWTPGTIRVLKGVTAEDLKSLQQIRPEQANEQLMQAVDRMQKYGQQFGQAPDVLSGAGQKSGETWRGQSSRLEQATKMLSVPARSVVGLLERVLKNNAYLNSVFLREEEILQIANHKMQATEKVEVGRAMYERNYMVVFRSDLKFSSTQQRISEADEVLQMPAAVPPLAMNIPFLYEATKRALQARGQDQLIAMLGPPPGPPQTPFGLPPPPPPGVPLTGGPPGPPGAPPGPGGGSSAPEGGPAPV